MARIDNNIITTGLRGAFGDFMVFRSMRGRTYVSRRAAKPDKKKETQAQRATRTNFREASRRARLILLDPAQREHYEKRAKILKLPNAYTAAVGECLRSLSKGPSYDSVMASNTRKPFHVHNIPAKRVGSSRSLTDSSLSTIKHGEIEKIILAKLNKTCALGKEIIPPLVLLAGSMLGHDKAWGRTQRNYFGLNTGILCRGRLFEALNNEPA